MSTRNIRIKQRDITDCGAACLASIARYYHHNIPVSRIRQYAGTDKKGTNVLGLIEAAEKMGFQAKGAKGHSESLAKIPLPAIAHLVLKDGLHHYVVIYKAKVSKIFYMDPADGLLHKVTIDKFQESWSGVIVLMLPDQNFISNDRQKSTLRKCWELIRPHRFIMIQALIGAVIYTILGLSTSIYLQKIIDHVLVEGNLRLLNLLSLAMVFILIFQLIIGGYKTVFGLRTGQLIDARLILGYYKHLLSLPQRFFDTMRIGEIISRVNDAVKIREFINSVALNIVVNGLIILFSLAVMFIYYWKLTLLMLAIIPIYLIFYFISNQVNKKWQRKLMEEAAALESQLVESMNAIGTIKQFGLEDVTHDKTSERFFQLLQSVYNSSIYSIYIGTGTEFFTRIFTIGLLWTGSYYVISHELSPGELLSFYALIGYFTGPASALIGANKQIQDALIAADRLFEIIDLETEQQKNTAIQFNRNQIANIHFKNIYFRYGTRSVVFEGFNLEIIKGQSTAIVGETGSGKSTLSALLQNIYPIKSGNIFIGNIDIQNISNHTLRKLIAVVPQQIDLFNGTVIDNIAIGDSSPDLARVVQLCELLGIHQFITQLKDGYFCTLNEQGNNLSGGQRQRLAIARALYRDPEILILDEATSNLDPISEQQVQDTLQWFQLQGKTIIIIAHRLSTVRNCNSIVVLQNGKLVEQGSHEVLMSKKEYYYRLWQQFHGRIL